MVLLVALAASPAVAEENIDEFARLHLRNAQAAAEKAGNETVTADQSDQPVSKRLELVYIQGVGDATHAYLIVDGQFGKAVRRNESIRHWRVDAIGDDYVDVRRGSERHRLLLHAIAPRQASSERQGSP
ncbi:hypothetical protein [Pandoraea terrae]|uniref:hypothetical protein n=1 Tax=Pandoraea terrae TaxID=1537710 RepID=UPI001240B962|nr:hypothetical protein [Pandoraea terrae]